MSDQALFESAADALRFAFHFSHQQYDRPLINRMADKRLGGEGKGLSGLDGAAQAGMIRRELSELSNLHQALLIARFAPHFLPCSCSRACCSGQAINFEWREAVRTVTSHACEVLPGGAGKFRLRQELVARHFGHKGTLTDIAERCGVRRQAASDHNSLIINWLRGSQGKREKGGVVGEEEKAIAAASAILSRAALTSDVG